MAYNDLMQHGVHSVKRREATAWIIDTMWSEVHARANKNQKHDDHDFRVVGNGLYKRRGTVEVGSEPVVITEYK